MVFSSITFLFYFLPVFLVSYFSCRFRNTLLLAASLFFYAWGELEYVLVLLCSLGMNYLAGLLISGTTAAARRLSLGLGILLNLFVLGAFKYANFMVDTLNALWPGSGTGPVHIDPVHLPLGISFFTFQAMSYLIDVYRRKAPAEKNPLNVALYISMFPQLVAGPIVRFSTIARQITDRTITCNGFTSGIKLFIIGLGQKMLIANTVAKAVDGIFQIPSHALDASLSWFSAVCYSIQIYYDFSGYSHMAIGLGLMMGFTFPENFNFPYISQSVTEFWRRWHITLSTWFRDYLYIPLGGNRKGKIRTYINLITVFFLCGLWHGAAWTFAAWGLYHGVFMVVERIGLNRVLSRLPAIVRHLYCLLAVTAGWVLFRAETFERAGVHLKAMIGLGTGDGIIYPLGKFCQEDVLLALAIGILCAMPLLDRTGDFLRRTVTSKHSGAALAWRILSRPAGIAVFALIFLISVMGLSAGAYNPFIYFRF